jgi:hypothetical protein
MSVIETRADEETTVQVVLNSVQKMLPQNRRLRLDVLARLLWTELAVEGQSEAGEQRDSDFKPKRVT